MQNKERMCVSCRQRFNQQEMLRIARINDEFMIDKNHKLGGRGAYICPNCRSIVIKKKLLNKSFKQSVPDEVYKQVEDYEQN